jgi:hypothetical protein
MLIRTQQPSHLLTPVVALLAETPVPDDLRRLEPTPAGLAVCALAPGAAVDVVAGVVPAAGPGETHEVEVFVEGDELAWVFGVLDPGFEGFVLGVGELV